MPIKQKAGAPARRRSKRAGDAVRQATAVPGPNLADKLTDGAIDYLRNRVPKLVGLTDRPLADADIENAVGELRMASRESHVERLALSYALYAAKQRSFRFAGLAEKIIGKALLGATSRKSELRCILEQLISYGDDSPESQKLAQKLYSRDNRAVAYLIEAKVPPESVVALSQQVGQGIDAWSRRPTKNWTRQTTAEPKTKLRVAADQPAFAVGSTVLAFFGETQGWYPANVLRLGDEAIILKWVADGEKGKKMKVPRDDIIPVPPKYESWRWRRR